MQTPLHLTDQLADKSYTKETPKPLYKQMTNQVCLDMLLSRSWVRLTHDEESSQMGFPPCCQAMLNCTNHVSDEEPSGAVKAQKESNPKILSQLTLLIRPLKLQLSSMGKLCPFLSYLGLFEWRIW